MSEHAESLRWHLLRGWVASVDKLLAGLAHGSGNGDLIHRYQREYALATQLLEALPRPRESDEEPYLPTRERALDWLSRIVQESGYTLAWDDAPEGEDARPRIVRAPGGY